MSLAFSNLSFKVAGLLSRPARIFLVALSVPLLGACSSLGYYAQAVSGQLGVLEKRRPISEVLADPHVTAHTKNQLRLAEQARRFASTDLDLPDNGSYRSYADLDRPYPVWNVVATRPFSVEPIPQCYLFIGCMSYRGYFHKDAAVAQSRRLHAEGMDVTVVPVTAYSTLGWFDDPVFNSMIDQPEARLVGVIFHELAHQRLFVHGDSSFNESFANFVEREGLRRWFAMRSEPQAYSDFLRDQRRAASFDGMLIAIRGSLARLYGRNITNTRKRAAKERIFAELQRRYRAWKQKWGGYTGYDQFMARRLNNADLALLATYEDRIPAFQALFRQEHDRFPAFYRVAARIGALPKPQRNRALDTLAAASATRTAGNSSASTRTNYLETR